MADAAMRKLWRAVRSDFDRARAMLPTQTNETEGSPDRLDEWLDHNELELALDELESLGEDNASPPDYWRILASAAERMGLTEHMARLSQRIA
jgi:hypothetical protein